MNKKNVFTVVAIKSRNMDVRKGAKGTVVGPAENNF